MHHLFDKPEILLGELDHDCVDMGVTDIDGRTVDFSLAIEDDAVAETLP